MDHRELAVVQGWSSTKATLVVWNGAPLRTVLPWMRGALLVAVLLLAGTFLVGVLAPPDLTPIYLPGMRSPSLDEVGTIVARNLLVLALHALACVAGFIAKSSLPAEAQAYSGWWRRVHDHAGPAAIAFVGAATVFSLLTQAFALGLGFSTLAFQAGVAPAVLMATLLPHAIPELVALFLPLAAWMGAARAGRWDQLLAATFVTTALALPVLVVAAFVEVYVFPLHFA